MSSTESDPEDAITKEEITGAATAPEPSASGVSQATKRNAFAELMAPKPKRAKEPPPTLASTRGPVTGGLRVRDGLGAYAADPAAFPRERVLYHDDAFVAVNDLYPKASVHALLIPRGPRGRLHPFDAFEDPEFLAAVRAAAAGLRRLAAKELQRRYGRFSTQDRRREAVLDGEADAAERGEGEGEQEQGEQELPPGRDWERELLVGVHAHPSMNDLHVHVLSRDMVSPCLRRRRHYQSFNTPFLVGLDDFPLARDDPRRHPGRAGYLDADMRCWRCGRDFGNRFKRLKEHLDEEFEEWKRE
ncbi:HIT domain-containing protein [Xylaria palmicola]|nr:HIT domain-containing protein [Xylaria palmicola]